MSTAPNGTYVEGVRIDDLRGTLWFEPSVTNLPHRFLMTELTYGQLAAMKLEIESLQREMLRS